MDQILAWAWGVWLAVVLIMYLFGGTTRQLAGSALAAGAGTFGVTMALSGAWVGILMFNGSNAELGPFGTILKHWQTLLNIIIVPPVIVGLVALVVLGGITVLAHHRGWEKPD